MTIDEAIKHAKKVAEVQEKAAQEWHENQIRKCELIPFAEMDYTHENEEDKELIVNKDVYDTLTEEQKKLVDIGLSYFNNRKHCEKVAEKKEYMAESEIGE